tara:strand:- start:3389 stop:4525 length:1137 start_codon:yes stop_codon:yes gene_type:complete
MDKVIIDNNESTVNVSDDFGLGGVTLERQSAPKAPKKQFGGLKAKPAFKPKPMPFHDTTFENFANQDKKIRQRQIREEEEEDDDESEVPDEVEDSIAGYGQDEPDDEDPVPSHGFKTIEDEKTDILYRFHRLEGKGIKTSKKFTMFSDIREMRMELLKLKKDSEMNANIKFSKRLLVAFVSGTEFLNKRYDPVGMELDGWSENVMTSVNDGEFDSILERLTEKYSGRVNTPPELDLMLALGSSALMFHITGTMFKNTNQFGGSDGMQDAVNNAFNSMNRESTDDKGPMDMKGPSVDLSNFGSMFGSVGNDEGGLLPRPQPGKRRPKAPSIESSDDDSDEPSVVATSETKNVSFQTEGGTRRRGRKPTIVATKEQTIDI